MTKLSIPTKKEILKFLNWFDEFLTKTLNLFSFKNIKHLYKNLVFDRRFIITVVIIILSIFAHLSTPAFYQDKWVLSKIKKQLESEFGITFLLPEEVNYSMFPIPSFYLNDVRFAKEDRTFGKIDKMKINLSYKKFLNKEKINIQDIHINNSQFDIFYKDIKDFVNFFDKQINSKKLFINESSIFLKDNDNEIYLILQIKDGISFFDELDQLNKLNINGEVYNNPFQLILSNNYLSKLLNFKLKFLELSLEFNNNLKYFGEINNGNLEIINSLKNFKLAYNFDKENITFLSNKEHDKYFSYDGKIDLKPFNAEFKFEHNEINLMDLFGINSVFYELIRSNVLFDQNLNYRIKLLSKKIKNYKKFNSLNLNINYEQGNLNLNDSTLFFDKIVKLKIIDSIYINNTNEEYFYGNMLLDVLDKKKLYSFLQTNKNLRDDIKSLRVEFKYDYKTNNFNFEKIFIDEKTSSGVLSEISKFNSEKKNFKNFIDVKKFSNQIFKSFKQD